MAEGLLHISSHEFGLNQSSNPFRVVSTVFAKQCTDLTLHTMPTRLTQVAGAAEHRPMGD
jgi:hypothetical protein